jgi:hypothetical protein
MLFGVSVRDATSGLLQHRHGSYEEKTSRALSRPDLHMSLAGWPDQKWQGGGFGRAGGVT